MKPNSIPSAGTEADSTTTADVTTSSQTIAKPIVSGRLKLFLDNVINGLASVKNRQRTYDINANEWFFPADVFPHSAKFKYRCKKLAEAGILECDNSNGRWGKRYRVPENDR